MTELLAFHLTSLASFSFKAFRLPVLYLISYSSGLFKKLVTTSGRYLKLGARGKDFQNWMFSKKKYGFDLVFPFFLPKS